MQDASKFFGGEKIMKNAYDVLTDLINNKVYTKWGEEAHNEWMNTKLSQGWVFGPVTDTNMKTNSSLTSFLQLSPADKGKTLITPYATIESLRNYCKKETSINDFSLLLEDLVNGTKKDLLEQICSNVHSHFMISRFARGELDKDDLVVYESLQENTKSWDRTSIIKIMKSLNEYIKTEIIKQ